MPQTAKTPTSPTARAAWRDGGFTVVLCIVLLALLGADLALKWWAFGVFPAEPVPVEQAVEEGAPLPPDSRVVVPNLLEIKLVLNRGAVFGMAQGYTWFFVLVTIVAVGAVAWAYVRSRAGDWLLHLTLALVLAGALGNLYDRVVFGAVRDMLLLFPGVNLPFGWSWGRGGRGLYPWVFNLADVYLTTGIALLVVRTLFVAPQPDAEADASEQSGGPSASRQTSERTAGEIGSGG